MLGCGKYLLYDMKLWFILVTSNRYVVSGNPTKVYVIYGIVPNTC